ncbi:penicillin-binding protein [Williamsia sp. 1138]|uniref:penicillin-binding transpeptidase domain-containing protein n=1 Tax=Williamsia sp. 1138 TaxID=1903117 RepID=UPI000A11FA60|nr:penicillin-binding transpeptidase domain-containing protein [Williamsia sp. 1138]OZG28040.1 penicillin-binding protein [Williamsia sp. 1138]
MRNVDRTRFPIGILLLVMALLGAGCAAPGDDPEDPFGAFASALTSGDASRAAEHTTDPAAADAAINDMFTHLGESAEVRVSAREVDDAGAGHLTMSWTFGEGTELDYQTSGRAVDTDDGWRLEWSPTLLHDNLAPGAHFQYSDDRNLLTPVVDRGGADLMTWQTVGVITLRRESLSEGSAALAPVLAPIDPSITDASIRTAAGQQQGDTITVATLRERDLDRVRTRLESINGVTVEEQGKLLTADRALKSPVFAGVDEAWNNRVSQGAGWSVSIVDSDGNPVDKLTSVAAQPTDPLQLTLDRRLQLLAQQAVAAQSKPAVFVAMSTSTGGLLAVAQNGAADRDGAIALSGLYPPGSTFKTITTAAALSAGTATPDTVLPCPGRATIEGRTIPNEDDFDLGKVPLSTAFARSCNTTMAALSNRLGPDALPAVAQQLGIGVDFVVPGIVTVTGTVPRADSPALRVENGIGQGSVTASPFGMAVAEASLGHGSMVLPSLIVGEQTTADTTPEPLDPKVTSQLRAMMRQTVTSGTASALGDIDGLGGKTGTAEYGDDGEAHGWFTGISGDIAFASLVVGGGSSQPAVEVAGDFLRPAGGA